MTPTASTSSYTRNFREFRREPCPICDHVGWCRRFDDGAIECMREASATPCTSGGWMHWPDGRPHDWRDRVAAVAPRRNLPKRPAGDKAQVDAAYRELLARCPLSESDRAHLHDRGLSDEQIDRHGYATLPADRGQRLAIAAAVQTALGWDPAGIVPGFIRKQGRLELADVAGILIPFRNVRGQVRGLQVRLVNPDAGSRYVWFSAGNKEGSVGQNGHLCHVARPPRSAPTKRVVVTEGPIKANIAADHFGCVVLAVAGVANTAGVSLAIKALGGVEDVAIAYDADAADNQQVAMQEAKLALELDGADLRVAQWTWILEDGKGIDDLIAAGVLPFPIPHPAITQDRTRHGNPAEDPDKRYRDLWRLHSRSVAAHHSPNLGAERHTLTDLALTLAGAPEGEPVPIPYKKLADQAGVSASTAERQLAKVGIRPSAGEAGILQGLIAVEIRPVPERVDERTGHITGGYDALHVRRLAPVQDILERIATAPPPESGKRNGHGGKRECPRCGDTRIERRTIDRCAGCGEILKQAVRIIDGEEGAPPPQDAATPRSRADVAPEHEPSHPSPHDAVTLHGDTLAHEPPPPPQDAARSNKDSSDDLSPVSLYRDSNLLPGAGLESDREKRRVLARADLAARYGPPPPAWQDLAPAQTVLAAADHADDEETFHRVTDDLEAELVAIARAKGRTPVPKPGRILTAGDSPRQTGCVQCGAALPPGYAHYCERHGGNPMHAREPHARDDIPPEAFA